MWRHYLTASDRKVSVLCQSTMQTNEWSRCMSKGDVAFSFQAVWILVSLPILFALLAPFFLSQATIDLITPRCVWKTKYHKECPVCGMTTSFILISHGRLKEANVRNKGSLALYAAFISNEISLLAFLRRRCRSFLQHLNQLIQPASGTTTLTSKGGS